MRRVLSAPLTWLGAILVVTDIRAWVSGSELGWFAGIATTLIVACIALLVWSLQTDHHYLLVEFTCLAAALTSVYLLAAYVLSGDPEGPRIAGALIALTVPLAPVWLLPVLALGLIFSQSYLAVVAAVVGLVVTRHIYWPYALMSVVLGGVVLIRMDHPVWGPRFDTWTRFAWPALLEHPWIGWGPGAWAPVIESAQRSANSEYLSGHAHSDLIEWAVEYGVLGLAMLAGFLVAAWSRFRNSPARGALAASGVLSLGLHVWHVPFLMPWLACVVALGLRGTAHD